MSLVTKMSDKYLQVNESLKQIRWHDSKFLSLQLTKARRENHNDEYELSISVLDSNKPDSKPVVVNFLDSRILKLDIDLLGLGQCSGHIGSIYVCEDAQQFEEEYRNRNHDFGLNEESLPLEDLMVFHIELIHPGGEIMIFARDVRISS